MWAYRIRQVTESQHWGTNLTHCVQVQVAVKCLSKEKMQNGTQEFLKEAAIMQSVDHENIVRMYGVVLDKENTMMLVSKSLWT